MKTLLTLAIATIPTVCAPLTCLGQADFGPGKILTIFNFVKEIQTTDVDGDGDLDIISSEKTSFPATIVWFENLGATTFGGQQLIASGDPEVEDLHTIDLDGDGDIDLISAISGDWPLFANSKIAWYENLSAGSFGPQQIISADVAVASSVYAADLDGDGDQDVLSGSLTDGTVAWHENLGGAIFAPKQTITTLADYVRSLYADDLDGDGDMDVLSASWSDGKIAWYANDGSGNFGPQQILSGGALGAISVSAFDLDSDGDADVLSAIEGASPSYNSSRIVWFENLGSGSFGPEQIITTALHRARDCDAADFDGDGDMDVVSASSGDDKVAWYENLGGGSFSSQQVVADDATRAIAILTTDLDGDGDDDIVGAGSTRIGWFRNLTSSCAVPENLQSLVLDSASAHLSWDTVSGAYGYRIRIKRSGTPFEKVLASTTNAFALSPLEAGVNYAWSVRAACMVDTSNYAPIVNFSTPTARAGVPTGIKIFPNPVDHTLHVSLSRANESIQLELLDAVGRSLLLQEISRDAQVDVSEFSPGVYFIRLTLAEGGKVLPITIE